MFFMVKKIDKGDEIGIIMGSLGLRPAA